MITITKVDLTLLQDGGRKGWSDIGVATSGAWDQEQYAAISALLGEENPVVFEVLAGSFEFTSESPCDLAVVGFADFPSGQLNQLVTIPAGEVRMKTSVTSYVGIKGLDVASVLGSRSTDTVSGLGPMRVAPGQTFDVAPATNAHRILRSTINGQDTFRFIPGPHGELGEISTVVSRRARSGIRLATQIPSTLTLASIPITPGAIQNTGSELIIVGPDGGVSGGYPVVGVIVQADQSALARLRDGQEITLKPISLDQVPVAPTPLVVDLSAL